MLHRGIEPQLPDYKTGVLPLNEWSKISWYYVPEYWVADTGVEPAKKFAVNILI